jgi:hypothetical protein
MTNESRMLDQPGRQPICGRALLAAIVVAPASAVGVLFFGVPHGWADSADSSIGHNPGLQVNCAFNPAFARAHSKECEGIDVEAVASNGGSDPAGSPDVGKTGGVS